MGNFDDLFDPKPKEENEKQTNVDDIELKTSTILMDFFGGGKVLVLVIVSVVTFLFSLYGGIVFIGFDFSSIVQGPSSFNFVWLKIFMGIALAIAAVIPVALTLVYIGSRKLDASLTLTGVNIGIVYAKFLRVLTIIGAVFSVVVFFLVLFRLFWIALIFGLIMGALIFLYLKFLKTLIDFFDNVAINLAGRKEFIPAAEPLTVYFGIFIALAILSLISTMVDVAQQTALPGIGGDIARVLAQMNASNLWTAAFNVAVLGYILYLIHAFSNECYFTPRSK